MAAPSLVPGLYRIDPGDGDVDYTLVLSVDPWVAMCVTDGNSNFPKAAVEAHGTRLTEADAVAFFDVRRTSATREAIALEQRAQWFRRRANVAQEATAWVAKASTPRPR